MQSCYLVVRKLLPIINFVVEASELGLISRIVLASKVLEECSQVRPLFRGALLDAGLYIRDGHVSKYAYDTSHPFCRPSGTYGFLPQYPRLKPWAIFERSLRDNPMKDDNRENERNNAVRSPGCPG